MAAKIRSKTEDGQFIPPVFWDGTTEAEFAVIVTTGVLNRRQCKWLYALRGEYHREPRDGVKVYLNKADLERTFKGVPFRG